jgi:ketosteroid isomerase-like protein
MNDSGTTDHASAAIPEVIRRYQDAHDGHDTEAALSAFAADARVVDEDQDFHGLDEIRSWLTTAANEYTFTRSFVSADAISADTWIVVNHLEGNFPGGAVDLRYQFVLGGDLIAELVIAP